MIVLSSRFVDVANDADFIASAPFSTCISCSYPCSFTFGS